jgi:hypothetical protein
MGAGGSEDLAEWEAELYIEPGPISSVSFTRTVCLRLTSSSLCTTPYNPAVHRISAT